MLFYILIVCNDYNNRSSFKVFESFGFWDNRMFQAYVIFVQILGSVWLERNITTLLTHVLDLVANPKAASSHVDAVYSRKCINFILRSVLGRMLGEKAQASACKEITHIVIKQMNSIG